MNTPSLTGTYNDAPYVRGVLQIVRFNWPFFVAEPLVVLLAGIGATVLAGVAQLVLAGLVVTAGYWTVASLIASYWVYDASILTRWTWLAEYFPAAPRRLANLHSGFDDTSHTLRQAFPEAQWLTWDLYDPAQMTEASIARARRASSGPRAERVDAASLPAHTAELDGAFLIFAAHEFRTAAGRETLFAELHRVLKPNGKLVLVEHMRDLPNFVAYGPGFLHFLGRAEWLRLARVTGFEINHELRVTPFVRVFVLRRSP
jgi:SAM-dependent methyltransferase